MEIINVSKTMAKSFFYSRMRRMSNTSHAPLNTAQNVIGNLEIYRYAVGKKITKIFSLIVHINRLVF